jgi:hypothetical protein
VTYGIRRGKTTTANWSFNYFLQSKNRISKGTKTRPEYTVLFIASPFPQPNVLAKFAKLFPDISISDMAIGKNKLTKYKFPQV